MAAAAILSIFFIAQTSFVINPALANLAEKYATIPYSTVLLLSTITSLVVLPFTMLSGAIAGKKVKYKTLTVISVFFILFGATPVFMWPSPPELW